MPGACRDTRWGAEHREARSSPGGKVSFARGVRDVSGACSHGRMIEEFLTQGVRDVEEALRKAAAAEVPLPAARRRRCRGEERAPRRGDGGRPPRGGAVHHRPPSCRCLTDAIERQLERFAPRLPRPRAGACRAGPPNSPSATRTTWAVTSPAAPRAGCNCCSGPSLLPLPVRHAAPGRLHLFVGDPAGARRPRHVRAQCRQGGLEAAARRRKSVGGSRTWPYPSCSSRGTSPGSASTPSSTRCRVMFPLDEHDGYGHVGSLYGARSRFQTALAALCPDMPWTPGPAGGPTNRWKNGRCHVAGRAWA
ncbi:hypothetical protein SALBM135S_07578 [Streptomyces alboniger]